MAIPAGYSVPSAQYPLLTCPHSHTYHFMKLLWFVFLSLTVSAQVADVRLDPYITTGLTNPSDIRAADGRLFVSEMKGTIRVVSQNGALLSTPFLDIGPKVRHPIYDGLFSFAFHPSYAQNGYVYVKYVAGNGTYVISRFSRLTADQADPASEQVLLSLPAGGHMGGSIAFGPDGYLYVTTGDGANGNRGEIGDAAGNAQSLSSPHGKILRIDVDVSSGYQIPPGNPFSAPNDNALDEIWAYGLRNPWRISFDRQTGDLWVGDNGQDGWEEVDYTPAGTAAPLNYGWRCYEGNHLYPPGNCAPAAIAPAFEFPGYANNGGQAASVIGGYVYRGTAEPLLQGKYLFADYASGRFRSLEKKPDGSFKVVDQGVLTENPVTFGEDASGELYVASFFSGVIFRVRANEAKSVRSGDWTDPATWSCQCVPASGMNVSIGAGHTVTLSGQSAALRNLYQAGQLNLTNGATVTLQN